MTIPRKRSGALDATSPNVLDNPAKSGKYIWRTRGDGKVRSKHAELDGKVFYWDNPPEGGHPGEAPNCRCWAEDIVSVRCERLRLQLDVDSNNLDIARSRWDKANKQVEEISLYLAEVNRKKSEIVSEVRKMYGSIGLMILRGGKIRPDLPTRMSKLLTEYIALEFEHAALGEKYKHAVDER